jgi:hypothetical protein
MGQKPCYLFDLGQTVSGHLLLMNGQFQLGSAPDLTGAMVLLCVNPEEPMNRLQWKTLSSIGVV